MSHSPAPVSPAAGPARAAPGTTRHGLPDDATVEAFLRDGAVVLRGVLDAGALAVLERGIEVNLAAPSPFGLFASLSDDPGRFFEDFRCWQRIPVFGSRQRDRRWRVCDRRQASLRRVVRPRTKSFNKQAVKLLEVLLKLAR